jgi:hypothetical protein
MHLLHDLTQLGLLACLVISKGVEPWCYVSVYLLG